jgi:hypothetical protein
MKQLVLTIACICFGDWLAAQQCDQYHPLTKGLTLEYQAYRKNNTPNGKAIHTIQQVEQINGGTKATIAIEGFAPNGKKGTTTFYVVECSDGVTRIDTRAMLSGPPDPDFIDEGSCITAFPLKPEVGLDFPDCFFSSKGKKNSYYSEVRLVNRKITGKETVTVKAGTFEAYVIEYDMFTVFEQGIRAGFEKHHKDWFVPGKGLVKTESYKTRPNKRYEAGEKPPYSPGDKPLFSSELVSFQEE